MALTPLPLTTVSLDHIATHCIAARAMIEETGTPLMRRLIDLLLFEIGVALADPVSEKGPALEPAE
ncbi:hypothetical protein [Methylobacterium sp. J-068]|uniref:hypothetical protein n=1 Tax=Methylobacterium sp. J-068 TaxID=2836649 RepID=UPI001FBA7470|nr:hypothetical protein [Methylobacterium sp. J-068]MCJ2037093.1 hypothetical protein [Methylobacterium sp. J-068]